jgi:hypothetical protein
MSNNLTSTNTAAHSNLFSMNRIIAINNTSGKTKNYQDSSSHIASKKANVIGLARTNNTNYSDGSNKNLIKSHLAKMRSSGYVTPKK